MTFRAYTNVPMQTKGAEKGEKRTISS